MLAKKIFASMLALCLATGGTAPLAEESELPAPVLTQTSQAETALIDPPTVVLDVTDEEKLENLLASLGKTSPSNAIFTLDRDGDAVGKDGKKLTSGGFATVWRSLNGKVIPVLAVQDEASADAAVSFFEQTSVFDAAVLSQKPELVKRVREKVTSVRGIIEYQEETEWKDLVFTTNKNLANVVLLPLERASQEAVTYVQARFKTVWVRAEDEMDLHAAIWSGAYGVVCEDFSAAYSVLASYTTPTHVRSPFIVAHRGLPKTNHENSVSGTLAALEHGATHVELDGMLTTDKRIVMMHDNNISRTATGNALVESTSYEQLLTYDLDLFEPKEKIPTLEEIIEAIQDTDMILVFEVKSKGVEIVSYLKTILEEYDFFDQCVMIAFSEDAIARLREEMPQSSVADLNSCTTGNFTSMLAKYGKYNCGLSSNGDRTKNFNEAYLRDRGYVGWFWTLENASDVEKAYADGLVGLTTNAGDCFGDVLRFVRGRGGEAETEPKVGDEVLLEAEKYGGEAKQVTGKIFKLAERDTYYDAIASYEENGETHYTPVFRLQKTGNDGMPVVLIATISAVGGALLIAAAVVAIVLVRRRAHKQ